MYNHKDDDDVAVQKQQLLQQKRTSIDVGYLVYQKIDSYLTKKYPDTWSRLNSEDKLKETDYIFSLGVERAEQELECTILFEEKKPRRDVLENLGKIANAFLSHPEYPEIKSMTITKTINKILGSKEKRTIAKYHACVQSYVTKPKEFGIADVSEFVNRIPKQYLGTSSSTSSFGTKSESELQQYCKVRREND